MPGSGFDGQARQRSNSELGGKNTGCLFGKKGVIRPKGFFSEKLRGTPSGGFEGSQTFFNSQSLLIFFLLSHFISLHLCLSSSLPFHLPFSLLFSSLSSFLFHLLFSALRFHFLCLSFFSQSFSLSLFLFLSISLSLSFSLSLFLSLSLSFFPSCCGLCVCMWGLWCVCGVWCGTLKKKVKKHVCRSQHASVCRFITSPCVPATRPHALRHVDVLPVHIETFSIHTRRRVGTCTRTA